MEILVAYALKGLIWANAHPVQTTALIVAVIAGVILLVLWMVFR